MHSMKQVISESSARKEKNFQFIGDVQITASKISIDQIQQKKHSALTPSISQHRNKT